eukprot:6173747-Pleurochrysis_carterae.AAC.1
MGCSHPRGEGESKQTVEHDSASSSSSCPRRPRCEVARGTQGRTGDVLMDAETRSVFGRFNFKMFAELRDSISRRRSVAVKLDGYRYCILSRTSRTDSSSCRSQHLVASFVSGWGLSFGISVPFADPSALRFQCGSGAPWRTSYLAPPPSHCAALDYTRRLAVAATTAVHIAAAKSATQVRAQAQVLAACFKAAHPRGT